MFKGKNINAKIGGRPRSIAIADPLYFHQFPINPQGKTMAWLPVLSEHFSHKLHNIWQKTNRVILTAGGVSGLVIGMRVLGLLHTWELSTHDQFYRFVPSPPVDDRLLVVGIDEVDIKKVNWPISNAIIAEALEKIASYEPRVIALDILREFDKKEETEILQNTIRKYDNIYGIEYLGVSPQDSFESLPAFPEERVGFNNFARDPDQRIRRLYLYTPRDGAMRSSLSIRLAEAYLQPLGISPEAANGNQTVMQMGEQVFTKFAELDGLYGRFDSFGYTSLPNFVPPETIPQVSYGQLMAGEVDPALIRDRIVLIGITDSNIKDIFNYPYNNLWLQSQQERAEISGVELHANYVSQILRAALGERPLMRSLPEGLEWAWIVVWGVAGAMIVHRWRSPMVATVIIGGCGLVLVAIAYGGFMMFYFVPLVPPLLSVVLAGSGMALQLAQQEQELKRSKDFLNSIIHTIPDPIFVKDQNYRLMVVNDSFHSFIGSQSQNLAGKSDFDLFPPEEAQVFRREEEKILETYRSTDNEEQMTDLRGNTYFIETRRSLHTDSAGNMMIVGVIRDITERKRLEAELRRTAEELSRSNDELKRSENKLRYLANHDPLTGLPNRKLFRETLTDLLFWGKDNQQLVGLLFLDLDGFKPVNDNLGHDVGDLLLQAVAKRIKNCLRSSDVVCRLGGDEFTVILPGVKQLEDSGVVAEKILQTVSQPYMLESHHIQVTASVGISVYPQDGSEEDSLLKKADEAMYEAKKLGRNCYQLYQALENPLEA